MASPNRIIPSNQSLVSRLRERPLSLAAGALVCGALLGGLAVYQPGSRDGAAEAEGRAETTGSAPSSAASPNIASTKPAHVKAEEAIGKEAEPTAPASRTAAVDCDEQTWPYLSNECAERKRRSVRVITTDKLPEPVVSAMEAPSVSASVPPAASAPPVNRNIANLTPAPFASVPSPSPRSVEPTLEPAAKPSAEPAAEPSASAAPAASMAAPPRDTGRRAKRKRAKSRERTLDDRPVDDRSFEDHAIEVVDASAPTRDRIADRSRGRDRSGARIVERWIEREYDVPSDDRSGRRKRVIVIGRDDGRWARDRGRFEESGERFERRGFFFGGGLPFR